MPRGKLVSKVVKEKVGTLLVKDPEMTGKALKLSIEELPEFSGLNYDIRTYQNIKKELRPRLYKIVATGIDDYWTLGSLKDYQIPTEALPMVLEIASSRNGADLLTIREAVWAGRLFAMISSFNKTKEPGEIAHIVGEWVAHYAWAEMFAQLFEQRLNTSRLDWTLFQSRGDHSKFHDLYRSAPDFKDRLPPPMAAEEKRMVTDAIKAGLDR